MDHLKLAGDVDVQTLLPRLRAAEKTARAGGRFVLELDCRNVDLFTSMSLAELAVTRRILQKVGGDLRLVGCNERVRSSMVHPLFEALMGSS